MSGPQAVAEVRELLSNPDTISTKTALRLTLAIVADLHDEMRNADVGKMRADINRLDKRDAGFTFVTLLAAAVAGLIAIFKS